MDRLRADRELLQAVPARLKKALELNLSGPMDLRGTFELAGGGAPASPCARNGTWRWACSRYR